MKTHLFLKILIFSSPLYAFTQSFQSNHFTIQTCADGVYAVIDNTNVHAFGNAGIVDLGQTFNILMRTLGTSSKNIAGLGFAQNVKFWPVTPYNPEVFEYGNRGWINASVI